MRVLVVEDEADLRRRLQAGLVRDGHEVDVAATGGEGLQLVREGQHDAVVLDLSLPDIDGLIVARMIRSAGSDVPILMLTARNDQEQRLAGFGAGADAYLGKPFAMSELRARLNAIVRR